MAEVLAAAGKRLKVVGRVDNVDLDAATKE
jgi:hypothetical protein